MNPDARSTAAPLSSRSNARLVMGVVAVVALFLFSFALSARGAAAGVGSRPLSTWETNGSVSAVTRVGNHVYIGGRFSYVGPYTGSGVPLNAGSGTSLPRFAKIDGAVSAVVSDGAGGYYVGGFFTRVGGVARHGLAHIRADGSLDRGWHADLGGSYATLGYDASVNALALSGPTLYIGGGFSSIGGQPRENLAAVDTTTGRVTAWNPHASGDMVAALVVSGQIVYVGGQFDAIGAQGRHDLAAVEATTGLATPWNPDPDSTVWALATAGSAVYAGGEFSNIGGQTRYCIAALDATTGTATSWDPACEVYGPGVVRAIAVLDSMVYVGGYFDGMGGRARLDLAAVDAGTGRATDWNPGVDNGVYALAVSDRTVYVGGGFASIGGRARNGIAQLDGLTGRVTGWNPTVGTGGAAEGVDAVAVSSSTVYTGGDFTSVGGVIRNGVVQLDARTGRPTGWNPNASSERFLDIEALAASGSIVYLGGEFSAIGGRKRDNIAALDARTGRATPWNPRANGAVRSLVVAGSTVYVAGNFSKIAHSTRKYIAALDARTGRATAWNARPNEIVDSLVIHGSSVYVGGAFTMVGGRPRNHIAALDMSTDSATAWNPNANYEVYALAASKSTIFVGGRFTRIGGQPRRSIAAVDARTGLPTPWNPVSRGGCLPNGAGCYPDVQTLAVSGSTVYAAGDFTHIGGQKRQHMAALDARTGRALPWNPHPDYNVLAIAMSGSRLYLGGNFLSISGQPHNGFAAFQQTPTPRPAPAPPVPGLG